ncbi:zf-HC2 domain-containing protein [Ruminococcus sp.]|uniref:zf-HC2 domain-containing protein n=1 Tax=Ruminococcus sp. TaxID=41978 RepID=UPI0025EFBB9A|nr:zf-HC2 domain-containing protein [Ruminococcus sp.]
MTEKKIPCNVIVDLLPLYKEDICSEETKDLVEEHIRSCEDCRLLCEQVEIPERAAEKMPTESETFKKVGKKLKKGKLYRRILIFLLAAAVAVNVAWIKLKFLPYKDYSFGMAEYNTDDGKLYQELNGDYCYNVVMPKYLEFFRGKLYIWYQKDKKVTELRIIPRITGDIKYVAVIRTDSAGYSIPITESVEFDPIGYKVHDNDEKAKQIISENHDQIEELMKAAQDKWGDYLK